MKQYVAVLLASSAFLLAACGGGGGGGNPLPSGGGSTPTPVPTATQAPTTTNASGVVVDDANGNPLSGVHVALMPWGPCGPTPAPASITPQNDGCPTPLPSPQVTTDPNGNFALNGVANGHYLLVIGNDVAYTPPPGYTPPSCTVNCGTPTPAPFTVQAVVHDNVTLTGGKQTLKAPTLPGNAYYTPPPWETNGDYRLATLSASTEMPCYIAWQYLRSQNGLAGASVDEWLTENVRAVDAAIQVKTGSYSTVADHVAGDAGGTDCYNSILNSVFTSTNPYAKDPRTIWFGGQWMLYQAPGTNFYQGQGLTEFPSDLRSNTDPNQPIWP